MLYSMTLIDFHFQGPALSCYALAVKMCRQRMSPADLPHTRNVHGPRRGVVLVDEAVKVYHYKLHNLNLLFSRT